MVATIRPNPSPSPANSPSYASNATKDPINFDDAAEREKCRQDGLRVVAAYLDSPEAMKEKPRIVEVMLKENFEQN